ncbi:hypothetical protein SAMN05660971_03953 [Halomonas cupida]|uniref:Uncharacterized protein n=2 Tax=Halomonas cupida TaxID=44933 RepID=A0A1M7LVC3_9GAMM|nr:hypothetical protein SAMN05660971_03953 [Halomonas cupida]
MFRVVPGATLIVVVATLISQFSVLLASLLPLKVIMLLGSTGIPRYFPSFFESVDRDVLVLSLGMLAIVFYLFHLISEKIITYGVGVGAGFLLRRSQKTILFESQDEVATQGYQRYSRSMASIILVLVISTGLSWTYSHLSLFLFLYIVLLVFIFSALYLGRGAVRKGLDEAPSKIVGFAANIGFLLAFMFMVWDFLWGSPPGLLVAVVSIILIRQGFSRITALVGDFKWLKDRKLKLNALFFHGHVLLDESKRHEKGFWALFDDPHREAWVRNVLEEVSSSFQEKEIELKWYHLGVQDVGAIVVKVFVADGEHESYLVKVFAANRGGQAIHEATLLADDDALPSLGFVNAAQINGLKCNIYKMSDNFCIYQHGANSAKIKSLGLLMTVEPSIELVSRFSRSKPPLWQRVDGKMVERLRMVAELTGGEVSVNVKELHCQYGLIVSKLKALPVSVFNPDVTKGTVIEDDDGGIKMLHWGRWSLEPIGAGWPVATNQLELLGEALSEAKKVRTSMTNVCLKDVALAALMFEMEALCSRQKFLQALELIPDILSCLEVPLEEPQTTA